jgi:hypothetical protein
MSDNAVTLVSVGASFSAYMRKTFVKKPTLYDAHIYLAALSEQTCV